MTDTREPPCCYVSDRRDECCPCSDAHPCGDLCCETDHPRIGAMAFVCRLCNKTFDKLAASGLEGVCYFCCKALIARRQIAIERERQS